MMQLLSSFASGFNLRHYTMEIRAMYTATNDSLSPAEILTLRVCSVLGEITPETLDYAQPGGRGLHSFRFQLKLVPISAQLELFCPPCNPT